MSASFYESDRATAEYLQFHYGRPEEILPHAFGPRDALDYAVRCVSECLDVAAFPSTARALDVGCAVGRSTFELARHCREVIGIDFSRKFIATANELRESGAMNYSYAEEGELRKEALAEVPAEIDRSRVSFEQGDASDLRDHLSQFDVVLAANLIDRLPRPASFLERVPGVLKPGGQLILTSPYTWLEEYTPKENWLGGRLTDDGELRTLDGLRRILEKDLELVGTKELPFLIREHARKFQWSVAQASLWRRK